MSPASKYTSMQTSRRPPSFSPLKRSLQSALASKRYARSHLLALRFEGDEDDSYWEDARSLLSLLTTTLVDASSRLTEVSGQGGGTGMAIEGRSCIRLAIRCARCLFTTITSTLHSPSFALDFPNHALRATAQ
ncbi:hypothetical protein EV702DRAFT_1246738 [Suillus placidus]|uniref:Uncharacterized protein n=1 Tax=Suillus placidus TaxID=48579 RepID=A0A9P6ZMY9_9AGAM|nr:hypothetical protein EV702DRAFT_1246738 [Suillus placidus]